MLSHRVSEYFGDIINVEFRNPQTTQFNLTHYGDLPWSQTQPKFASIAEKYSVFKDGHNAKRTEEFPAHCETSMYRRFFVIKKFKAVTTPPSVDKPEKRRS
jgi:hypothetical protein